MEDRLNREERLRLECLTLATIESDGVKRVDHIISRAKAFEEYVRNEKLPTESSE